VLLAKTAALAAFAVMAAPPHIVFGDRSAGKIVAGHTTAAQAAALYGAPTRSRARGSSSCLRTWPGAGLTVDFLSFDGAPCSKGVAVVITLTGSTWRTARGLRIGDPVMRIHDLFPGATHHASGWWLVTRHTCKEGGGAAFAGLRARMRNGRVAAFVLQAGVCE
jgi:hypothetical protein